MGAIKPLHIWAQLLTLVIQKMPPAHSSHSLAAPDSTIFFSNHWIFISWWSEDCQIIISWSLGNVFFKLPNYINMVMPRERFILTTQRLVHDNGSPGRGASIKEHYTQDFTDPDRSTHILDSHRPHWFSILDFLGLFLWCKGNYPENEKWTVSTY